MRSIMGAAHPARGKEKAMNCVRNDEEIARVEDWAAEGIHEGGRYSGMSYEQGILDTILWIWGGTARTPLTKK